MFDFVKGYRFTWPVEMLVPSESGQQVIIFTGVFQLDPEADLAAAIAADPTNADLVVARRTLIGWKDDLRSGGKSLEYTEATRDQLLSLSFGRYAVAKAYYTALNGAVRLKN